MKKPGLPLAQGVGPAQRAAGTANAGATDEQRWEEKVTFSRLTGDVWSSLAFGDLKKSRGVWDSARFARWRGCINLV